MIALATALLAATAADPLPRGEIVLVLPNRSLDSLYPREARRAGAQTSVVATCRVARDHRLACTDPRLAMPEPRHDTAWRDPAFDPAFAAATLRLLAASRARPTLRSGGESAGRTGEVVVSWSLP